MFFVAKIKQDKTQKSYFTTLHKQLLDTLRHIEGVLVVLANVICGDDFEAMSEGTAYCRSSTALYVSDVKEEKALNKEFGMMDKPRKERGSGGLSSGGDDGKIITPTDTTERYIDTLVDKSRENKLNVLKAYENEIVDSAVEKAIVILSNGEVYEYTGTQTNVDLPLGEIMKGAYVTHNHPKNSPHEWTFSDKDLRYFQEQELDVLRGIDEKYIFQFDRYDKRVDSGESESVFEINQDGEDAMHLQRIDDAKDLEIGYRRVRR